jgi:hypothetical protein
MLIEIANKDTIENVEYIVKEATGAYVIEFNERVVAPTQVFRVYLKNKTNDPVFITNIKNGCSCTTQTNPNVIDTVDYIEYSLDNVGAGTIQKSSKITC